MKRYCVLILTATISPLYSEIGYDQKAHFFDDLAEAESFMEDNRAKGIKVSDVIDRENLPF